ncbi:MAG: hypothetical protein LBQ66_00165 [Planctomycetaceae bacterium]|nr:hypothetical protein [Planctomycetaceae bacterium]
MFVCNAKYVSPIGGVIFAELGVFFIYINDMNIIRLVMIKIQTIAGWSVLGLVCLIFIDGLFAQNVDYTAYELAKLRDAFWNTVTELDMEYSEEFIYGGKKSPKLPMNRWSMDSKRERLIYHEFSMVTAKTSTDKTVADDLMQDGEFIKHDIFFESGFLNSFELKSKNLEEVVKVPKFSSVFEAMKSHPEANIFDSKTESYRMLCPVDFWLMFRRFGMSFESVWTPQKSFASFVGKCDTTAPIKSKNDSGDSIWTFTVRSKSAKENSDKRFIEAVINESKGFFLERVASHSFDGERNGTKQEVITEFIIKGYHEFQKDRFFPKEVVYQYYFAGEKPENFYQKTYRIENVLVNKSVPDTVFDFRFPEHVIVIHHPSIEKNGERFFVTSIWGADNKPQITFDKADNELDKYLIEKYKDRTRNHTHNPTIQVISIVRVILCTLGIILIFLAIFFRSKNKRI